MVRHRRLADPAVALSSSHERGKRSTMSPARSSHDECARRTCAERSLALRWASR